MLLLVALLAIIVIALAILGPRAVAEARREAEAEAASRALDMLGRQGAMTSHDLGNMLTVLRLNAEELLDLIPEGHPARRAAESIEQAAAHGSAIARVAAAHGRRTPLAPVEVELGHFVHDLEPVVDPLLHQVELEIMVGKPRPVIMADPVGVEQVVLNLVTASQEWLGRTGTVEIEVTVLEGAAPPPLLADGRAADHVAGSAPGAGRWARLAARQPRLGPPADVLPRLLDPLWIASDERTGTGIELGTARDVLVRAGGHLRVAAGEGRGTCVEAFWPM